MDECNDLIRSGLVERFDQSLRIDEDQGDCRIIFPFVRPDGDAVILYVIDEGDEFVVTDEGSTHGMLFTSGVEIDTEKRENRVNAAEERFNLEEATTAIRTRASEATLAESIFDAYRAVIWISFLLYDRRPYTPSYFTDRVATFLNGEDFKFERDTPVRAESGDQTVDFAFQNIPRPTYLQGIQARDGSDLKEKSENTSYKWIKIHRVTPDARCISVVDNEDGVYKKSQMTALFDDSDAVISWEEREDLPPVIRAG